MALFSLTILPIPGSPLTLLRISPPSIALCHPNHHRRLHSTKPLSLDLVCSRPPRASLSGNDPPQSPGDEDPLQSNDQLPQPGPANSFSDSSTLNESLVTSSAASYDRSSDPSASNGAPSSSSSASASPVNNAAAAQFANDGQQQEQLRETLATLSQSLALLSSTLSEVSSAVRVLSASLGGVQSQSDSSSFSSSSPSATASLSPPELRNLREAEAREESSLREVDPPEPWDSVRMEANLAATQGIGEGPLDGTNSSSRSQEDTIPPYLVEQNRRAHKLAYRLQQAFIQARIEGLGKPFQVAVEEFTEACMEAHGLGIGLKELQLQLVLQDGSLTGAFAIRNQRWSDDPILNEESRIRALWVRLVYATLARLGPSIKKEEGDPIDSFVKQVLQLAFEQGYDLERVKLAQNFAGPEVTSGAVKAMRENQYLILLTLEKSKSQNQ